MENAKWKYHYLYKTTNLVNETYYIGIHSTSNLSDGYLGSGQHLRRSIKKYGRQNFRVEILEWFDDRKSLSDREREVVNQTLVDDPMCMNHGLGGHGGFKSEENRKKFLEAGTAALRMKYQTDPEFREHMRGVLRRAARHGHEMGAYRYDNFRGKRHSDETKRKIGLSSSISQRGERNSQFGTCWITDGVNNKKIKRTELSLYDDRGWRLGRI